MELISRSSRKDDRSDARMLARLARTDPKLLGPPASRRASPVTIRARALMVEMRTKVVNGVRGFSKSVGERLPACATSQWDEERIDAAEIPAPLRETLRPLIQEVESLTAKIDEYDKKIEQIARERYPETALLQAGEWRRSC